jgi:hypothetical protein
MGHTSDNKPIKYASDLLNEVIVDMIVREKKGFSQYNHTMDRKDLTEKDWIRHAYEEALDLALYLKKIMKVQDVPSIGVTSGTPISTVLTGGTPISTVTNI